MVLQGAAWLQSFASEPTATSTKRSMIAATVTVALFVAVPPAFVAVRVKGVVLVTLTATLPLSPPTGPTPLSIASVAALAVVQASVTLPPPGGSDAGVAVKLAIVGAGEGITVTVRDAV